MDATAELQRLRSELQEAKSQIEEGKSEIETLKSKLYVTTNTNHHSASFWSKIAQKIIHDTDYIKSLINDGTIGMNDVDDDGMTLLHYAAWKGNYEIAQLCLNLDAHINAEAGSENHKTPLIAAVGNNHDHIEQLLLLKQSKTNAGDRIKGMSKSIIKQNGIIQSIMNELTLIGEQSKDLFIKTLQEITINIITKKLVFSDDLLNLCWKIELEKGNELKSELWKTITRTCQKIISSNSKRDWVWLQQCILPSNIWCNKTTNREESKEDKDTTDKAELYYKLLNLVNIEAKKGIQKLEKDLNDLEQENKNEWNELVTFDIEDKYKTIRQDIIPGGLKAKYSRSELLQRSTAKFDSVKFYDHNQYMSNLVLLAQICDDEFQKSIQKIFQIDTKTYIGHISIEDDEKYDKNKNTKNVIKYTRGPVKLMERAVTKAQNDYADRQYPTSACVVDLNRCSLIFDDITTLLAALKLFQNKIKYYQSGNIIEIVRHKNGFIDYIKNGPKYADIKLNVLIRGETNNIVGEVQFLLQKMVDFKSKSHNLYSIQREEKFMSGAVQNILPILLRLDKQLNISILLNDVEGLCNVMVFGNKSNEDIICIDKKKTESVLQQVCICGSIKIFKFLQSLMTDEQLVDRLFLSCGSYNQTPLEESIQLGNHSLAEYLLSLKCVQNRYHQKDHEDYDKIRWRLIFWVFYGGDIKTAMYFEIFKLLGITTDDIRKYTKYKYPKTTQKFLSSGWWKYHTCTLTWKVVQYNLEQLKRLTSIIGENLVSESILVSNWNNINSLEYTLFLPNFEALEYILSLDKVRSEYLNNKNLRWRVVYLMSQKGNDKMKKYIVKELNFSEKTLTDLISYSYPVPTQEEKTGLDSDCFDYWNETISFEFVKKLMNM